MTVATSPGLKLYVRDRQLGIVVLGAIPVAALAVTIGMRQLPVGVRSGVPLGAPLWAYLPVLVGALAAMSHPGHLESLDRSAVRPVRTWNTLYTAAVTVLAVLTASTVCIMAGVLGVADLDLSGGITLAEATTRNIVGWTGACLLGGWVLGKDFSWLPAVFMIFIFEWFGRDAEGMPLWWSFSNTPPSEARSWIIAALLGAAGLLAVAWNPWRVPVRARRFVSSIVTSPHQGGVRGLRGDPTRPPTTNSTT